MPYLALARKYRPQTFADVIGQDHIVRTLGNAIRLDRVHHAFLFTGARGVGKTTTARVLARALNCRDGPTVEPCGVCAACVEIASGANSDVLEIDGASNTGVDNVRELRESVRYLPSCGRVKIYIIDEVHMLSTAAFNALLKTLEEPPPHVKFVFATTEPQKIPVTIVSRCQRFDFRRVSMSTLSQHLGGILEGEGYELSSGAITAIAREAQGSVRDALSLLDQVLSYVGADAKDSEVLEALGAVDRQTIFDMVDAVLARRGDTLLELCTGIDERGHDLADVAGLLVEHLRDLAVAQVAKQTAYELPERSPDELAQLTAQSERLSSADIHRLFGLVVEIAEDVSRSDHPRLSFEMGLLRLLEVEPTADVQTLLRRIEEELSTAAPHPVATSPSGAVPSGSDHVARAAEVSTESRGATARVPGASADRNEEASESGSWSDFVDLVETGRPALAAVLRQARPVRFEEAGVELAYERGFCLDRAREREHQEQLEHELAHFFRRETRVKVLEARGEHADIPSLTEQIMAEGSDRESELQKRALEHPAVQSVVSILGGEVESIKPFDEGQ